MPIVTNRGGQRGLASQGAESVGDSAPPLSPVLEQMLLERIRLVQDWVAAFTAALGKRRPPQVKTRLSPGNIYYAPIANKLMVPSKQLLLLADSHLRLAVAHEMGHFARRGSCLLAWTVARKFDEEIYADQHAVRLTGATVAEWASAILAVAAIEEPGDRHEQSFIFKARLQLMERWAQHETAPRRRAA